MEEEKTAKECCDINDCQCIHRTWGVLRISMGLIMFWAFIDKLLGLGFATEAANSWLAGGSPTSGFLTYGTSGPFASIFQALAGNPLVDWIYMLGLGLIGLSLLLGIGVRIAGHAGALFMFLLYIAVLPKEHHPFMDEHIIYLLVLLAIAWSRAGRWLGLGKWWRELEIVKRYPFLE